MWMLFILVGYLLGMVVGFFTLAMVIHKATLAGKLIWTKDLLPDTRHLRRVEVCSEVRIPVSYCFDRLDGGKSMLIGHLKGTMIEQLFPYMSISRRQNPITQEYHFRVTLPVLDEGETNVTFD
jgi:hypothetical protein